MLEPYRVIDLTDANGFLCGKYLGDMGADVIKVERPGGDWERDYGPFVHGQRHPEKSLFWLACNSNKRGITLDIGNPKGQEIFKRLTRLTDIIIESFEPGYMDELGLGYSVLSKINPRLSMISITPFGQSSQYRKFKVCDIIVMALSGMMYVTGDPDRPPVRISTPQSYVQVGAHAAMSSLVALYYSGLTGEGQYVDFSIQQALIRVMHFEIPFWEYNNQIVHREGVKRTRGRIVQRQIFPCKDGFVTWALLGGYAGAKQLQQLLEWMRSEGKAQCLEDTTVDPEGVDLATVSQDEIDLWDKVVGDFFLTHTKNELFSESHKRAIPLAPVDMIPDLLCDEHLLARGFWKKMKHPKEDVVITYPGLFYSSTLSYDVKAIPAPCIGEHNQDIYMGELGLTSSELKHLQDSQII